MEPSPAEQAVIRRCGRPRLFEREYRHELFDEEFQSELRKLTQTA